MRKSKGGFPGSLLSLLLYVPDYCGMNENMFKNIFVMSCSTAFFDSFFIAVSYLFCKFAS